MGVETTSEQVASDPRSDGVSMTVGFTQTVAQKADRLMDEYWIKYELQRFVQQYPESNDQIAWRKGWHTKEYHLVFPEESFVIVALDRYDHWVVVTQMHTHFSYRSADVCHRVSDEQWRGLFGNRRPATEPRGAHYREQLAVADLETERRLTSPTVPDTETALDD